MFLSSKDKGTPKIPCLWHFFPNWKSHVRLYSLVNSFCLVFQSPCLLPPDVGVWPMFYLVFDPTFASKIFKKNITDLSLRLVKPRSSSQEKWKCWGGYLHLRGSEEGALHRGGAGMACFVEPQRIDPTKDRKVKTLKCWYCVLYFDLSFLGVLV